MARLGGKGRRLGLELATKAHIWKHASMEEAMERYRVGWYAHVKAFNVKDTSELAPLSLTRTALSGDDKLPDLMAQADRLIDEAIALDPRLARKNQWQLSVDCDQAVDMCPAAFMAGEERCYIARQKARLRDQAEAGERTVVVISTDSKEVSPSHAVAFIAAAKLAQQFKPLEIWWQGGWLYTSDDKHPDKRNAAGCGHILLAPLVQGTLDFARLQFFLSSFWRDNVSYRIMFSYAMEYKLSYSGGVGERSYLNGYTDKFISEKGIQCDAKSVAGYAADWAGLPPLWEVERESRGDAAEQYWCPPSKPEPERRKSAEELRAEKERQKRWDAESKEWEHQRREKRRNETESRIAGVLS